MSAEMAEVQRRFELCRLRLFFYFSLFSIRSKIANFLVALHVRIRGGAGGPSGA